MIFALICLFNFATPQKGAPSEEVTLAVADPAKQTTLNSEVVPDPLDEDQPEIDTDIKQLMMENGNII